MQSDCSYAELFALRVLGDSMEPEFPHGAIIVVEPADACRDGSYVVVDYDGETWFRQFIVHGGRQFLRPLNEEYPLVELTRGYQMRGIVVQQSYRRKRKHYPV